MSKIFTIFITIFITFSEIVFSENAIWNHSNANNESHRYSELKKINTETIENLDEAWSFRNGYIPKIYPYRQNNQLTPIFTGKSLITSSLDGFIISLNPETGKEKWRTKLRMPVAKRGLTFFDGQLFIPTSQGIVVLNENSGLINTNFGEKGFIGYYGENFLTMLAPIVNGNNLLVAHQKKVESYSLPEGKTNWSLNLNGSRIWSGFSFDKITDTIVIVTSNLINLVGKTNIDPDFSNSIIFIDSNTGKVKCKFKDTLHDHWDMDMTGSPIIAEIKVGNEKKRIAYGFSKTGNIFVIDIKECKFFFKDSIKIFKTEIKTDIPNQTYSDFQKKIIKPTNNMVLKYNLNSYIEYLKNNGGDVDYINFISRNSLHGEEFIPLSLNKDVIMFGIHGGAEWPGGTYDKLNNQIILPTNHYPWIIRTFYTEKKKKTFYKFKNFFSNIENHKGKKIYKAKCQSCHGAKRQGIYEAEFYGDNYIPSLTGITFTNKIKSLKNKKTFNYSHKYTSYAVKASNNELTHLKDYFNKLDKDLKENDLLNVSAKWQLFLNKDKQFASKPPWGKITAYNKDTGTINWEKPFGERKISSNKKIRGDINFGGVLSTKGNLLFATGTPDKYLRAFKSKDGSELWKYKMDVAGSSPPMTYLYKDEQYIVINASGGRFFGFEDKMGDYIYAFKLKKQ